MGSSLCGHTFRSCLSRYKGNPSGFMDHSTNGKVMISFVRNCQIVFQYILPFAFPSATNEYSSCSSSLPAFIIYAVSLWGLGHSTRCWCLPCFNLQFLVICWSLSHMFTFHLHIFSIEKIIHLFWPFQSWICSSFTVEFKEFFVCSR